MIRQRPLTATSDLQTFAAAYEANGGHPVSLEYLQASLVYGCFDGDQMVGGYVVNESDDLRALHDMPEADVQRIRERFEGQHPYEVMCLWVIPQLRRQPKGTVVWLMGIFQYARRIRRPLLISTVHEQLLHLYEVAHPTILYRGEIAMPDGTTLPKYVLTFEHWWQVVEGVAEEVVRRTTRTLRNAFEHGGSSSHANEGATAHAAEGGAPSPRARDRLALYGGQPIRTKPWPTYDKGFVMVDDDDVRAAEEVVRSRRLFRYDTRPFEESQAGQLELEMAKYLGARFAVATTSGTTALSLALLGHGIGREDTVAVPAFTFPGAASAVYLSGARLRLIEVDENLNMDVSDLATKLDGLSAVIVCHMRGVASSIEEIRRITAARGILLVEDAVPVFGTTYNGRMLGTFGDAGCFSFQSDKAICCGEGGLVVTPDQTAFERMARMAGTFEGRLRRHTDGFGVEKITDGREAPILSWRLDEMRAALARVQLRRASARHARALANYAAVSAAVDALPGWRRRVCPGAPDGIAGDSLIVRPPDDIDGHVIVEALRAEGIDARLFNDPLENNARCFLQWRFAFPHLSDDEVLALAPRTAALLSHAVDIPLSPLMTEEDRSDLVRSLEKVAGWLWAAPAAD